MMKSSPAQVVITVVIAALALGVGLVIGYLSRGSASSEDGGFQGNLTPLQLMTTGDNETATGVMMQKCRKTARDDPAIKGYLLDSQVQACQAASCHVDLPNTYVVYKLDSGIIDIDGKLDERAWTDVAWTEPFVDIRGGQHQVPRFETRVKLRWDDRNLYVGAYLQEYAVWANRTLHDTTIYQDNSFQALFDTTQSNHKYKEISINALGIVSDIMLTRPYMDDGEPLSFWESEVVRAVYTDGPINDPSRKNKFWTVEMAIPFKQLYAGVGRTEGDLPQDREIWRANFMRTEWQTEVVGSKYLKRLDKEADFWTWQPHGVANLHLPDKWGLLQFRDVSVNSTTFQPDKRWITLNALLDIYRAQKAYKAVNGQYTEKKDNLHLPPYILSKRCIRDLDIQLDWGGFRVTARPAEEFLEDGHTRTDRFVWFGQEKENFFRRK